MKITLIYNTPNMIVITKPPTFLQVRDFLDRNLATIAVYRLVNLFRLGGKL